jgi:integrase/recombinase XerD
VDIYPEGAFAYIEGTGRLRTESSRANFKSIMRRLHRHVGGTPIKGVTADQLTSFCLQGDPAPATIKARRAHLRSFFEWAAWKGFCKTNPSSDLKFTVVPGKHTVREGNWLTEQQIETLIRACSEQEEPIASRDRLVLGIGFMTGLRAMEIAQLRWPMFNAGFTELRFVGKGQKLAQVGLPLQLTAQLLAWRQLAPADAVAVLPAVEDIWVDEGLERHRVLRWDHPIGYQGVYQCLKRAGRRCEMNVAPHDMRRSFAGILQEQGTPVADISLALRHGDVGVTSRYLDMSPRRALATGQKLTFGFWSDHATS